MNNLNDLILNFINNRDFSGSISLIDFFLNELNYSNSLEIQLWNGYSHFHLGNYENSILIYENILKENIDLTIINLYLSSCYFYLNEFEISKEYALKGPLSDYRNRLLFHISQKLNNEDEIINYHEKLIGNLLNQLSLASIHYIRSNYNESLEIYQNLLLENPNYLSFNVYISMCQFKLGLFEECNLSIDKYLNIYPDSAIGINIKSCTYFKLYGKDLAQSQLLQIKKFSNSNYKFLENLINHNLCIFNEGIDGFKILPQFLNIIPESKLNLSILYLKESNYNESFNNLIVNNLNDITSIILKAFIDLLYSQINNDSEIFSNSLNIFEEIISKFPNTLESNLSLITITFMNQNYLECLKLLNNIEYIYNLNDEFNFNKAMTLCCLFRWVEAEHYFLKIKKIEYIKEIYYNIWLTKCFIMNKKPEKAWELYLNCKNYQLAKHLLQIISFECYNLKFYYYSMKSYHILSKVDLNNNIIEGLIASSIGVFNNILNHSEDINKLYEIIDILETEPNAINILNILKNYIENNSIY